MDVENLRRAINDFMYQSKPASSMGSDPATVNDVRRLINNLGELLNQFVDELETD